MNEKLDFMDFLSICSFLIGLQNLDMNLTQEDMQKAEDKLSEVLRANVMDIHDHLEMQDRKLDRIMEVLKNDNRRDISEAGDSHGRRRDASR